MVVLLARAGLIGAPAVVDDQHVAGPSLAEGLQEHVHAAVVPRWQDPPGDHARGFQVAASTDGTDWTSVATCTGTGNSELVSFPAQTDRYVEVTLTQPVSPNWWSVDELYLRNLRAAPQHGPGPFRGSLSPSLDADV
jgi:hypothetical protein